MMAIPMFANIAATGRKNPISGNGDRNGIDTVIPLDFGNNLGAKPGSLLKLPNITSRFLTRFGRPVTLNSCG
jgi:hypothetical protein